MRISELSAASQVPIPTIKYYLREGLLPQGEQTSATRAVYDESHLRRLRLIRALLEVGRLPLATIHRVIAAVQDEELGIHELLGVAHYALAPEVEPHPDDADWQAARERADDFIAGLDWEIHPDAPTRAELAQMIVTLDRLGMGFSAEALRPYAEAAHRLVADHELARVPFDGPRDKAVEHLVTGTVLYGKVFDVMRRLAHESESAKRVGRTSRPATVTTHATH